MTIRLLPLMFAGLILAGCGGGKSIQNEAAVRQGVIDYLSKRSDLNLASMQVDVTSVSFRQNEADATVSFRPKGSAGGAPMAMRYTLERQGDRWVVKGRGRGQMGQAPHGAGQMPPGAGGTGMSQKPAPGAGSQGQGGASGLPPGHPPIGGKPSGANK